MLKKLKTLDKILLVAFVFILTFGLVSGFAVNRVLTKLLFGRAQNQIISATELIGRTVALEMDAGNFRGAWHLIHLNVGKNSLSDFILLDSSGNSIISDPQSENKIIPIWKKIISSETRSNDIELKKIDEGGSFLAEYKFSNLGNKTDSYSLILLFEDREIAKAQIQVTFYIFSYALLLISFLGYLLFFFRSKLLKAIERVNLGLESIVRGEAYEDEGSVFSEYLQSKQTLEKFTLEFKEAKNKLEDQVKLKIFGDLTRQVAHDIRSPLSALNMVMHGLSEISEEKRLLIRNAVQRINDISNDLLTQGKRTQVHTNAISSILLSTVVDSIISEKRTQFRDKINVKIELILHDSFGIFVNANATELSRCISNLVNNSVEALKDESGEVNVSIKEDNKYSVITIKDNGRGIPEDILSKLGDVEITYGKDDSTSSGTGLGVYRAKKIIAEWGGEFKIYSKLNVGTTVEIRLLKAISPSWFASSINIVPGSTVVTVDDDLSVHQIWKGRLESIQAKDSRVIQKSFTSSVDFLNFPIDNSMIFLIDYEFLNQDKNGLELIREKDIASKSILVTSRYEEHFIKSTCENLGLKLLPKQLSGFIPMMIEEKKEEDIEQFDYVLIDDDELVQMTWEMRAKQINKSIKVFSSYEDFLKEASVIGKKSNLYIDIILGNGVRGERVAEKAFALGYTSISLATGYEPEEIIAPAFIKQIIGKGFPK